MRNPDFPYPVVRPAVVRGAAAALLVMTCTHAGPSAARSKDKVDESPAPGVVHVVESGQTLWRIARAYGIELEELARANDVTDPSLIEAGQLLFVPGATSPLDVPPYRAPKKKKKRDRADWLWPVADPQVLSRFGASRRAHHHQGIDVRGASGGPVVASRAGRVVYSGSGMRGYGKTVVVDHGDGTSSLYAHNSRLLVHTGEHVERGQAIAEIGRSGNATTEHCHFEIRQRGRAVDPLLHLEPPDEIR
jgi:murein DD-endopeptidase MepM/ murein hydrolase activator NlpD